MKFFTRPRRAGLRAVILQGRAPALGRRTRPAARRYRSSPGPDQSALREYKIRTGEGWMYACPGAQ